MDFVSVDRVELLNILINVKPGLAKRDIISQADKFLFKDKKVQTYNDEVHVGVPFDIGIECAAPSTQLYDLLSRMKEEVVQLKLETVSQGDLVASNLHVKGSKIAATISVDALITSPLEEVPEPDKWYDLPVNFLEALDLALVSTGTDMSKPVLTCIHWNKDFIESCDNFRVTRYNIHTPDLEEDCLLPSKIVNNLKGYSIVKYSVKDSWAHFLSDKGAIFSCHVYSGTYVDLNTIFNAIYTKNFRFTNSMLELLERIMILAEKDVHGNSKARLDIKDSVACVTASNDIGNIIESTRIICTEDLSFDFRIETLLRILQKLKIAEIDDAKKSLRFKEMIKDVDGKDTTTPLWTHVISLC